MMTKQISIAWGFFGIAILGFAIGNAIKYRQTIDEMAYNCADSIEKLSDYIQKRFDDLTYEEIISLAKLMESAKRIKSRLPHYKHMY